MTETYAAWWPIHDDSRTFNELTAEALDDLWDMVAAIGYIIPGWIRWETDEWPDAGLVLLAVASVVRHPGSVLQEELAARSLAGRQGHPQTAGGASTRDQAISQAPPTREGPRGRTNPPVDVPAPPLPTTEETT